MRSTKKSLIMSTISLVLCFAMLLGSTYAWFTDEVTSGKNKIISGNLDVELKHYTTSAASAVTVKDKTDLFKVALWEPGVIAYENFIVSNEGNLALKYALNLNVFDKNTYNGNDLTKVIKVAVVENGFSGDRTTAQALTFETLADFQKTGNLAAGNTTGDTFGVVLYWEPTDHDNDYNVNNGATTTDGQPLFIDFGVNLVATQLQYESDSFGDDYDVDTIIPALPKNIDKQFKSAPISGKTYEGDESVKVVNKNDNSSTVASVPAAAVKNIVENLADGIETKEGTDVNTVLVLSVTTNEMTATKASYNIDLTAVMTYTDNSTGVETQKNLNSEQVDALLGDNIVVATVNIGKDLLDVSVKHNGEDMTKLASADTNDVGFYYAKDTGDLTIKTKSFSPFEVSFKIPEAVKEVSVSDGTNMVYMAFADFHDSFATETYDGKTVTLLKDIEINDDAYVPMKDFRGVFDGDNHTITLNTDQESNDSSEIALFTDVTGGTVKNLTINGNIKAGKYAAALAVKIHTNANDKDADTARDATFENIINNANVTAPRKLAGIVVNAYGYGSAKVIIKDCVNNGIVTGTGTTSTNTVAGIISYNQKNMNVIGCKNFGEIKFTGTQSAYAVGGIVGILNYSTLDCTNEVSGCYNYGDVSAPNASSGSVGSIIGRIGCSNGVNPLTYTLKLSNLYDLGTATINQNATDKHPGGFIASIADQVANANNQQGVDIQVSGTMVSQNFTNLTPHRPAYDGKYMPNESWTKQENQQFESNSTQYTVTIWTKNAQ